MRPSWVSAYEKNKRDFLSATEGEDQHIIDVHMHLMGAEQYRSPGGNRDLGLLSMLAPELHAIVRIQCRVADNFKEYRTAIRPALKGGVSIHAVSQIIDEAACPLVGSSGAAKYLAKKLPGQLVWKSATMAIGDRSCAPEFARFYGSAADGPLGWFKDSLQKGVAAHAALTAADGRDKNQAGQVVPWFFAPFDPRREDGLDLARAFLTLPGCLGVKLYSRNGWCPDPWGRHNEILFGPQLGDAIDKRLMALYRDAEQFRIPLLCHTSPGGWPPNGALVLPEAFRAHHQQKQTSLEAQFEDYDHITTAPANWEPVLKRHPQLQVCLAHLGGGAWKTKPAKADWIDALRQLMRKHEHVYGDVSYWIDKETSPQAALKRLAVLIGKDAGLAQRVMFGTDWYLTMQNPRDRQWPAQMIDGWTRALRGQSAAALPALDDFYRGNARRFIDGTIEVRSI